MAGICSLDGSFLFAAAPGETTRPSVRPVVQRAPASEVVPLPNPTADPSQQPPGPSSPADIPSPGSITGQPSLLSTQFVPIDLPAAVRLAGLRNPDLFLARQMVVEAVAIRQFAAAQLLPNLNAGTNFDAHSGPLQQSNGNILRVSRSALYVGAGANAVAAGTVNIPGVQWNVNASNMIFGILTTRQLVREREFANFQTNNDILQAVGNAYYELLRAEGLRAVNIQMRDETAKVAKVTRDYARVGEGRPADADRAATELAQREVDVVESEGNALVASARLCQLLNLDPSTRLHATDEWVVPIPLVPEPIPLQELIAIAMLERPDLAERRAAIRETFLAFRGTQWLPFSPTTLVGFSAGTFGGGSNIVAENTPPNPTGPRFGDFSGRNDFDVIMYWPLQNCGCGNAALINAAQARLRQNDYRFLIVLNQARADVASAYAISRARFAQVYVNEQAARIGRAGFEEDFLRTRNSEGLPIETLDNLRLWNRARVDYLNAIIDFNEAQVNLYCALGQPRAAMLARPAPLDALRPAGANPPAGQNAAPAQDAAPAAAEPVPLPPAAAR
ncbi:MAG TPA: TolC family protein [Pirellulales bacterium]|nr:TolC family protein [Pirellulales bacterium]